MRSVLVLGLVVVLSIAVSAQLPTSTLNGTVTDPQGAIVAGAKVSVVNNATGGVRDTATDAGGFYSVTNLMPGDYTVRVEAPKFATAEVTTIRLEVGRASTVDVKLALAKVGETVTVQAEEAQVNTTQSEVQGIVEAPTITNMPLNGRNFLELAFLVPGNRPATNFDPTKTNTLEVSSAGAFGRGGNIAVDGGDNNDEVVGGTLANFPQDSVQEFQIATNKFTAEVGRSGSSIINIVTKSGTNNTHGSAFMYFRHKALQALPALVRDQPAPRFVREQFGGSAGGPIKKDKAFWFVSTEYRNQDHALQVGQRDFNTDNVITTSAPAFIHDLQLLARTDFKLTPKDNLEVRYGFNRTRDVANGSLKQPIGSAANRQSSFNRFNSPLANWTRLISPRIVNSLIFHADYFLNSIPAYSPDNPVTNPSGLAGGNEVRFPDLQDGANFRIPQSTKFNRYQVRDTVNWNIGNHTLGFGGEYQHLNTYALFDLYGSGSVYTIGDFGGDICRKAGVPISQCDFNGDGVVNDLDIPISLALKSAAPSRPPIVPFYPNAYFGLYFQDDWKAKPNLTLNLGLRWESDDVLGQSSNLHPCASLTATDNTCGYIENILGNHPGRDFKQFGPRIGFVWDPLKRGQTVIRGGYGIYYDRVVTEVPLLEALLNGRILPLAAFGGSTCNGGGACDPGTTFDAGTPTLANPFAGASGQFGIGINHIANNAKHPMVQQFTVGVQQQVATNWIISADGIHDFGTHSLLGRALRSTTSTSPFIFCPNGFDPCTAIDPSKGKPAQTGCPADPTCQSVTEIESSAKSWYDALFLSLQKRPTGGPNFRYGFNANYTLSKTFDYSNDDQIPFNGTEDAVNLVFHSNNLQLEKGYSPTDERHRFNFNGIFEVPWKLTISSIYTLSSRVPMDSQVPALGSRLPTISRNGLGREITNGAQLNSAIDLWNSLPSCPDPNPNTIPCNPGVQLNHVDPNLKFGHNFNTFSLGVSRTWTLPHEQGIKFTAQVFNLFNVTNIRGTNNNNYSGYKNDITSKNFNQPTQVAGGFFGDGGPRIFQFALRYTF
jgi:hypothetical protein